MSTVLATTSLSFEGGGYWIDMEIGFGNTPIVVSARFHAPGDPKGIVLPRKHWHIETFDTKLQILVLRHHGSSTGVAPFILVVQQQNAVLTIGGRKINSQFKWHQ